MAEKNIPVVGGRVEFLGYAEEVDNAVLVVGESYEVIEVLAAEETVIVRTKNPDFDENADVSEENAEFIDVDAFFDEVKPVAAKAVSKRTAKAEAPAAAPKAKPAAKAEAKAAPKAVGAPAKKVEEAPAPKGKAKAAETKATTKPAPKATAKATTKPEAKGKVKAAPEAAEEEEENDAFGPLAEEDAEILALVEGTEDILELAEDLVEEGNSLDYKLGGVLFHIRQSKEYRELDERYKQKGGIGVQSGFSLYLQEKLNLGYRKAMHLIEIYHTFNRFGIPGSKVAELGWTKASKIVAVMTETNADELIELAGEKSVSELTESIKDSYTTANTGGTERRKKVTFKFKLYEDQATAITEIMTELSASLGIADANQLFEHVFSEYAIEHGIGVSEQAPEVEPEKAKAPAKRNRQAATA